MRVWTCTDHDTVYPVGGSSIVVAESEGEARRLLSKELRAAGLRDDEFSLHELPLSKSHARILDNGDY